MGGKRLSQRGEKQNREYESELVITKSTTKKCHNGVKTNIENDTFHMVSAKRLVSSSPSEREPSPDRAEKQQRKLAKRWEAKGVQSSSLIDHVKFIVLSINGHTPKAFGTQ